MEFWIEKMKNESDTTFFMLCVRDDYEWLDNCETFLDILENNCGCTIVSDEYAVYIRQITLEKNGYNFSFYHDSLDGGYICTEDDKAVTTLETVANDVIAELQKRALELKPE